MVDLATGSDPKNIVSQPPLTTPLLDNTGRASRAWAIWFRDLYVRTAYKGGNAIDNNLETLDEVIAQVLQNIEDIAANKAAIEKNAEDIAQNASDIASNAESIIQNALAIAQNADNIAANASAITLLSVALDSHVNAFEAHGSNGNVVGFNDLADESTVGLVKRMADISDAIDSTVDITTPDIASAPAAYDQTYIQTIADLTNENKAAINQLATDLNNAIGVLNNLLAESKTSGQMTTP